MWGLRQRCCCEVSAGLPFSHAPVLRAEIIDFYTLDLCLELSPRSKRKGRRGCQDPPAMNLMVKSRQNLISFPKCPAIRLDRRAAPWAQGRYPGQLPLPLPVLSPPYLAWPRGWTTQTKPQAQGRKHAGASFLPVTPETTQVPSGALRSILSGIAFRGPVNFKTRVE